MPAQHYILDIREEQLYMHAMSGVTLFRDIAAEVFDEDFQLALTVEDGGTIQALAKVAFLAKHVGSA